jgi:Xaa-Pro aminopeptidase
MPRLHQDFRQSLPFDSVHLDALMEREKIDVLLVTSKHNIQYLLGGYRFFFCDYSDAIGVSRYLPILVYPRGRPQDASYIGQAMEISEVENQRFWTPKTDTTVWGAVQAMHVAVDHVKALGVDLRVGIEFPFMPADAFEVLRRELPENDIVEGHFPLERLRSVKRADEIALIHQASERVVDSMIATFAELQPGMTKHDVVKILKQHELDRDLIFEYCLISAGTGLNRAPSDQILQHGDILSLDSGGRYGGYIGDLCRMGIIGAPDAELVELLAEIETIQQAARKPIRAGATGRDIYAVADPLVEASSNREFLHFVAHGMGIIGHEAPRISGRGPVTYEGYDMDRPLEAGMVLSIETTMHHPRRGLIKLEDTLAVTQDGLIAYGDHGRGWNVAAA